MKLTNRTTNIIAAVMLAMMVCLTFGAMTGDSLTMDEQSHLPAGYSYVTQKDMRINPEHPPLVKDLAGIPLLFIKNIHFPSGIEAWQNTDGNHVNAQWDFGHTLLFASGNPADEMIFWGRLPMIGFLLILGFYLFKWTRELFGNAAALIALTLFAFSPNFLGHGHLVTTDVAAAVGIFVTLYYFVAALKKPTLKNSVCAGLALGAAELLKFSCILLYPYLILLAIGWWIVRRIDFKTLFKLLFVSYFVCFLLIGAVYIFHTWNYPPQKQVADSTFILSSYGFRPAVNAVIFAADKPVLRAYAQYILGVLMATQRVTGGNTTYFMGQISKTGWKTYFPAMYLVKETIIFHLFTLIALLWLITRIRPLVPVKKIWAALKEYIGNYLPQITMVGFLTMYWLASITGALNIGVRHLMPVFPLTMSLAAGGVAAFGYNIRWRQIVILALCAAQIIIAIRAYPSYLAYYNALSGGSENGYKIAVDSNTDWGQDLKRLTQWIDYQNCVKPGANCKSPTFPVPNYVGPIDKIYVDYFGGADAKYYLGSKFQPWWCDRSRQELPAGSYLAISATFLEGGRGTAVPGSDIKTGCYDWLNTYRPITIIGHSIFVYHIQ